MEECVSGGGPLEHGGDGKPRATCHYMVDGVPDKLSPVCEFSRNTDQVSGSLIT